MTSSTVKVIGRPVGTESSLINFNGLSVLDGIISHLARGGPGKEVRCLVARKDVTFQGIEKFASLLGAERTANGFVISRTSVSTYEALFMARAMLEVLMDSIPKLGILPMEDQLSLFNQMKEWPKEKFTSYAKYITVWPMAKYLHNPAPNKPDGFLGHPLVWKGKIKRILKNRLISYSDLNSRLWQGVLQGVKRGAAPVSDDFIKEAMVKHRTALSKPSLATVGALDDYQPYFERFFASFVAPEMEAFEASTSASYESMRSEGGARGYIRRFYKGSDFEQDELLGMYETAPGVVEEVRGFAAPPFSEILADAMKSPKSVAVSAVVEPLKVRVLTKGSSLRYYFAKFFQKGLWKFLKKSPQFQLTNRPDEICDLISILEREKSLGVNSFDKWVSGDYTAATDNLDIAFTKLAFEASLIRSKYSDDIKDVLRSVLYEQTISYPKKFNGDGSLDPIYQSTGQLMGSILSFPILCCVNVVCYWKSLEDYLGKDITLDALPVLVNGDDILFRANDDFYQSWQEEVSMVGFTLSTGKNYIHKNLLTVNSHLYRHLGGSDFRVLPYYNTGLLLGQSRVTGRKRDALMPIWDNHNRVVHGAIDPVRASRRFFHYNRKKLVELSRMGSRTTFNAFLPFERGGLGFDPPVGLDFKLTNFQQHFATFVEHKFRESVASGKPGTKPLGIVQERVETGILPLKHSPVLVIVPSVGPNNIHQIEYIEPVVRPPPLAVAMSGEKRTMTVRFPKRAVMSEFRSRHWNRMGWRNIHVWPYRLAELVTPLVEEIQYIEGFEPFDELIDLWL